MKRELKLIYLNMQLPDIGNAKAFRQVPALHTQNIEGIIFGSGSVNNHQSNVNLYRHSYNLTQDPTLTATQTSQHQHLPNLKPPSDSHVKLSSVMDRSKYFSAEQYRQKFRLKINSSIALEEGEHKELKDILRKVMIKGALASNKSPERRVSDQSAMQKSQNVYDAILARSKRSRMEKQPNGYASVQDPVNEYATEYKSNQKDISKQRKPMQTPFSHSMLIAVKRNVSPERDASPFQHQNSIVNQNDQSFIHQLEDARPTNQSTLSIGHSQSLRSLPRNASKTKMQPYKALHTRVPSLTRDQGSMLQLPKITSQQQQEDTVSRITRKGPHKSMGGQDDMISKFITNLSEDKKNKLVQILNNNRSSMNMERPEIKVLSPEEPNEYHFTIDTFDDKLHFSKKGIASSRSPPIIQHVTEQEKMMINQDSSREYLTIQKSLGILDLSNQNIKIMDDDPQPKNQISKPMKGHHSVHFTPKPPQPNTILGLHEEKVDISNLNNSDKKCGKGDHLQIMAGLRRTVVPLFSGGLAINKIADLNQFIERELQHLSKGAERPFKLELSVSLPNVNFLKTQDRSQEELMHELYQQLGRNALISFHKYRSKLVVQKDPTPPANPKALPNQAPSVEEKKKPTRKEREPKATMNSEPVVPVLVKRIAKFTGVQPATREQLGVIEWHGDIYMYGGAGQKAYADLKRLQPEKNEWVNQGEIQNSKKYEHFLMKSPDGRFGHSCHLYRDFMLVFGGSGLFNMEIKKREVHDDVLLYDLNLNRWIDPLNRHRDHESITQYSLTSVNEMHLDDNSLAPYQAMPPIRRYGHASAVLGCTLFIHGGISGEDNNVIVDTAKHPNEEFAAFDLQTRYWIRAQQEELINEDTGERTLIHTTLSSLAYHSMTPVFEPALSRNQPDTYYSRMMWVKTPTEIMALPRDKPGMDRCTLKYQGLYLFGGYNKSRECASNKLYLIKPSYNFNKQFMSIKNAAWKRNVKPRYTFEISEVPCNGGQAPSPRFSHSAIMVSSKYLLIYGGRNDNFYKQLNGNVALNDLHLFDLLKLHWITVALFLHPEVGPSLPMSRWGHNMVSRDDSTGGVGSGSRILVLGGMNSKSYCEGSTVYEWCFDEKLLALTYDDSDQKMKAIILQQQAAQATKDKTGSNGDNTPKE